jgi:glucokinase
VLSKALVVYLLKNRELDMTCIIADVGGTNMRIAQTDGKTTEFSAIRTYAVTDFPHIEDVIKQYQQDEQVEKITHACVAIACPISGDKVSMTNHSWTFSIKDVKAKLALDGFYVINDFTANAMCLPHLSDDAKVQIGGGNADFTKPLAVYGPGTGLGVAHLVNVEGKWVSLPGEGGHASFAPNDELEQKVLSVLMKKYGHVSVERIVSGPGLLELYQALCQIKDIEPTCTVPAEVTDFALQNKSEISLLALSMFCRIMGSFGGNLALNMGTYGGVYIAGGIVPRFIDFFKSSEFRQRFEAKGRFKNYLESIPVYVVTEKQPGLLGAAAYLAQSIEA